MEYQHIEPSLTKTLKSPDSEALLTNLSEFTIDQILEEGLLRDIPIFGTIYKVFKIGGNIRDYVFAKMLYEFLSSFSTIPEKKRLKLIDKLDSEPKFNRKAGEYLILLLDRLDNYEKPKLVSKVFFAYLESKIDIVQLQRMNFGIDRVFYPNLMELEDYYDQDLPNGQAHTTMEPETIQNLANCSFLSLSSGYGGVVGSTKNDFGRLFVNLILK